MASKANPFKIGKFTLPVASINSVYIDDIKSYDLFRPSLILEEINKKKTILGLEQNIDNQRLSVIFNNLLNNELDSIRKEAYQIARKFGNNLAKLLITLKKPSLKSITNRTDWDQKHWDFWKSITTVYLVGGLTSPILTSIFYECVSEKLLEENITDLTVTFIEGSENLGTKGLSTLVENGDYLLFDFGQTSIKRQRQFKKSNKVLIDTILPSVKSKYLFYKEKNEAEIKYISHKLDDYIVNTIHNTIKQVAFKGNNILMSIANYVNDGVIFQNRGGYGKLRYVAPNYEKHLSQRLSELTERTINVELFHDTSAMGIVFKGEPNTAVISLGTAFGVAFPE